MSTAPEPCRTCRGTGLIATAAQNSRAFPYEVCPDCDVLRSAPDPHDPATQGGGTMIADATLFDAVDGAAQQLAVIARSLEGTGDAGLYRSALEAHAYTAMLRAELRARRRWAQAAEQARARPEPEA